MENNEQFEKDVREAIRLYVHEYCFMAILDDNFKPGRIAYTYKKSLRQCMKYLGLLSVDERYLRTMVYEWLRQKYGREYGEVIRKRFSTGHRYIIPRDDKFFMPISEFNDAIDRAIYYRKNCIPYPFQITK